VSDEISGNFNVRIVSAFTSINIFLRFQTKECCEEHRTDHKRYRNRPHSFQNGPKTVAAVSLNVLQWHR
jgi:hypothetical protein